MAWTVIKDDALRNEFVRVYSDKLGRPATPDELRIEQADDAVRVRISYSGSVLETTDPDGDPLDLLETVTNAAVTLAQIEHDNEYH
jgi:hypothetical protein